MIDNGLIVRIKSMLLESLDFIIDRYKRDPEYRFIDTKFDLLTGADFYPAGTATAYRDKEVIYSWIQGRGLEALAGHALWLEHCRTPGWQGRVNDIKRILGEVIDSMENCRRKNHGRLFFAMARDGQFLKIENCRDLELVKDLPDGANYSELFYSKGLLAAAAYLGDTVLRKQAAEYFERVLDDIMSFRFVTDQQMLDPANPVTHVPGKRLQGSWMIALSGTALAADVCDRRKWLSVSGEMITRVFDFHVNTKGCAGLERWDFWEAVDETGRPWLDGGKLICDPGHALEFIGLSTKCLLKMRECPETVEYVDRFAPFYPELLRHNFRLGFASVGGIVKTFDLLSRSPVNTDMPWWSLPETIRAAANVQKLCDCDTSDIIGLCAKAFLDHYVNPQVHRMAIQTRDRQGRPALSIPAVPDADPAYHTGLSLIDFLTSHTL